MIISMIAAMAKNRVIGGSNQLVWNIPEDMKYFRTTTKGHPVIMGRKTYESMGKPLPGRFNVVITRQRDYKPDGVAVVGSLEAAIELCRTQKPEGYEETFIIGGAQIYEQAMDLADRIYITVIEKDFAGDAYFPEWDIQRWVEVSSRPGIPGQNSEQDPIHYTFKVLEKKNAK